MKGPGPKPKALTCSTCGGKAEAWLRPETKVRGVVVFPAKWVQENTCDKCEAARIAAEEAARNEQITRERLARAGLGEPRLAGLEFRDFRTDGKARERVASMVRPLYSKMVRSGGEVANLVLSGAAGTGKTHLAVCFAKAALARGRRVHFCQWPEAMLRLREASLANRHLEEVVKLTQYDVLVLDDVGAEKATEFVIENLYLIVDRWWRASKQGLIVTTNLSISKLGEVYGDRVASRLAAHPTVLVDFEGCPDGRIENLRLE